MKNGLLLTPEALASTGPETVLITIRVMNLIHTPLCIKFQDYTGGTGGAYGIPWSRKISDAGILNHMMSAGVDQPSDIPRFAKLGLNKWFADLLNTGLDETGTKIDSIAEGEIGPFPAENDVAFQTVLHLDQNDTRLNHAFQQTIMQTSATPGKGGDLNYHAAENNLVKSPLGITTFNMGKSVETTNGFGFIGNRIFAYDGKTVAASGQTVNSYVDLLSQNIGAGFINENLLDSLDEISSADRTMRTSLKEARVELKKNLELLKEVSAVSNATHEMPGILGAGNIQAFADKATGTAEMEFIAQCLFVKRMLSLPGTPLRNFSLFLNIYDPDGAKLDTPTNAKGKSSSLNYIEAMRQLGIGMNILGQAVKSHGNAYVAMFSEGGRGANMGDNKASHAFVMGPGTKLKDHLYADEAMTKNPQDPFHTDSNEGKADVIVDSTPGFTGGGAGLRKYTGKELKSESGQSFDGYPTIGQFLNGMAKHLESEAGVESTTIGLGNYIKIVKK